MATRRLGTDNTGDSGPAFKVVVRLCGLAAIAGVFLPFMGGLSILDVIHKVGEPGPNGVVGNLGALFSSPTTMGMVTNVVLLSAYVLFPVIGLYMALRGKYAGGPFTFLLLFNLAAFLLVNFFGVDAGIAGNFFVNTGLGYWVGCGGLLAPFIAMFFLDKSI